ncbi:hypothetical protein EWM64_g5245 [Hericium alpestre]|uniref:GBD/FH3 domain-containing protein n=1 Tax=Hericium alpestre TaxID=135208 RepID=A0A4Y9ZZB1_9AGAM|nr:hypothetical protein EWM64_g5245 [Hericium alpestre]
MPDDVLIVPIILPTGSLHFASIRPDGTVQDAIDSLTSVDEVIEDVVGDLDPSGWCLQTIRQEESGRQWEDEDLEALGNASPTSPPADATPPSERLSVSEPTLVAQTTGSVAPEPAAAIQKSGESDDGVDMTEFSDMLSELGLKEAQRQQMYQMPPDRKRYLLEQHRQFHAASKTKPRGHAQQPSYSATFGPSSASTILPRLTPQLTGDAGFMRRISISGWGASNTAAPPIVSSEPTRTSGEFRTGTGNRKGTLKAQVEKAIEDAQPIQPQTTGGLWSSWWNSSGGERRSSLTDKGQNSKDAKTPKSYADGIRGTKPTDMKLVKQLISLRVHLSTAALAWIQEFVNAEKGVELLGNVLAALVGKGGKRKSLADVEAAVLLEVVKCFRVLLNTETGFGEVLSSPTIVTHIAYSLHASSAKLRILVSDLLAAICLLSLPMGHKAVLAAMSDYRVAFEENFRFEELISSLRLPETEIDAPPGESDPWIESDGSWEARTGSVILINALTNCPESLEDRVMLREEFSRRGLNEAIVTLRYIKPPDSLITQLDVYTEEKFEDEEDMRERVLSLMKSGRTGTGSDAEIVLEQLLRQSQQHTAYPKIIGTLNAYSQLFQLDLDAHVLDGLISIIADFIERIGRLRDLSNDWQSFVSDFLTFAEQITNQHLDVNTLSPTDARIVFEQELEALRSQVEELSDEHSRLRDELDQRTAEITTLRSLSPGTQGRNNGKAGQDNLHGVVQRLVQKEKQVLQLQSELDKLKSQSPSDQRDADERAKRERDKVKWNNIMDEMANMKIKLNETEKSVTLKDKEVMYLKRALESVYSRFRSREEDLHYGEGLQVQGSAAPAPAAFKEGNWFFATCGTCFTSASAPAAPAASPDHTFAIEYRCFRYSGLTPFYSFRCTLYKRRRSSGLTIFPSASTPPPPPPPQVDLRYGPMAPSRWSKVAGPTVVLGMNR